jgi:hypothetical protein
MKAVSMRGLQPAQDGGRHEFRPVVGAQKLWRPLHAHELRQDLDHAAGLDAARSKCQMSPQVPLQRVGCHRTWLDELCPAPACHFGYYAAAQSPVKFGARPSGGDTEKALDWLEKALPLPTD